MARANSFKKFRMNREIRFPLRLPRLPFTARIAF